MAIFGLKFDKSSGLAELDRLRDVSNGAKFYNQILLKWVKKIQNFPPEYKRFGVFAQENFRSGTREFQTRLGMYKHSLTPCSNRIGTSGTRHAQESGCATIRNK